MGTLPVLASPRIVLRDVGQRHGSKDASEMHLKPVVLLAVARAEV